MLVPVTDSSPHRDHEYLPVSIAVPAFATVQAIPVPDKAIPGDMWGLIQSTNYFTVRQHLKLFPKSCCTCPPCVKQENTYSVYAGLNEDAQSEVLRIDEVSDDWNRCCCAPSHPVRMEVRPYVPIPGDSSNSDYAHIRQDILNSWQTLAAADHARAVRDMYKAYPPMMSFVRYDGQRCCFKCPCRIFNMCTFCGFCQDGMDVYAGSLEDEPGKEVGRPYNLEAYQSQMIGSVTQPVCGGYCHPVLELREGQNTVPQGKDTVHEPFGKLEGPCFFGGWSEFCCDFMFPLSRFTSPNHTGDLGAMVKKHPTTFAGKMRDLIGGDNSVYTIQFDETAKLTASQKSTVLAAQILYDYMLFDGRTEKCRQDDSAIYCYFCYCSVFGCLLPCELIIPKPKN